MRWHNNYVWKWVQRLRSHNSPLPFSFFGVSYNLKWISYTINFPLSCSLQFMDLIEACDKQPSVGELLGSFNEQSVSDYLVVYLRLVTSGYLQREEDFFQHFIEGGRTVREFCQQVTLNKSFVTWRYDLFFYPVLIDQWCSILLLESYYHAEFCSNPN